MSCFRKIISEFHNDFYIKVLCKNSNLYRKIQILIQKIPSLYLSMENNSLHSSTDKLIDKLQIIIFDFFLLFVIEILITNKKKQKKINLEIFF